MPTFNAPIPGATTIIAELELRNNPDSPVVDTTKVRGGALFVLTLPARDLIPMSLRKQGTTRVYVANQARFYFLPAGIENYHWQVEATGDQIDTDLMAPAKYYVLGKNNEGAVILTDLDTLNLGSGEQPAEPMGFVVERKTVSITNLNTEGIAPGVYRVVAGASVFPIGGNVSGPTGAWGQGTLLTINAETIPFTVTQVYYPDTSTGAVGTRQKNVYTRTCQMNTQDAAVLATTPWRMLPFAENIASAVVSGGLYSANPGDVLSLTYPFSNIAAANPPFTVSQLTTHPWLVATLNSSNVQLTGIVPADTQTGNNTVLLKVRDSLGVETVFSLTVAVAEAETVYDGAANLDFVYPDTADFNFRMQCVTPGISLTNKTFKPAADATRYLRPDGSTVTDPTNLYALAATGSVNGTAQGIKFYRFGINLGKIKTDFPSLASIKFDVYGGKKTGFADDIFFVVLNRALGGTLAADAGSPTIDWVATGTDANPGGTSYPANPNSTTMFKTAVVSPTERKVATVEYFFGSSEYTITYLTTIMLGASLWQENGGALNQVSALTNNQQLDFPQSFDFYVNVEGVHDRVQGLITRPNGQTSNFDTTLVQAINSDLYQFNENGSEARQYGTYQFTFRTFYQGVEKGLLNMSVVSRAPVVPTTYTVEPMLRNESVSPVTSIPIQPNGQYDLPELFDIGWNVTGDHDQVQAFRTTPNGQTFTWGPESVGNVSSGYYQMNGPGNSEARQYGTYVFTLKLFKNGVERVSQTTTFVSKLPTVVPNTAIVNPGVEEFTEAGKQYTVLGSRYCSFTVLPTGKVKLNAPETMQSLQGGNTCNRFVYFNHVRMDAGQLAELLGNDGLMLDYGQHSIQVFYFNPSVVTSYDIVAGVNPFPAEPFALANAGPPSYLSISIVDAV